MSFFDTLLASSLNGGGGGGGNYIPTSQKGAANGVATLDANGKVPQSQLPLETLFDESGSEVQVGYYKLSNNTKKPLYRKDLAGTAAASDAAWATLGTISNLEAIIYASGVIDISETEQRAVPNLTSSIERNGTSVTFYCNSTAMYGKDVKASVYYTKTSDTPA